jgi:ABC-2 type transport system ATP-binding protein
MIQIENLNKSYGKKAVPTNISLTLYPGKIQGLAGDNGSGKTTLFECIRRLTDYEGDFRTDAPAKIGYLPAEPYFYPNMKGREYVEFCLAAGRQKTDGDEIMRGNRLFELPLNEYAANYSTGMKKKREFFSLIMQRNDVFILDEPFNGLDLASCLLFKHIILRLKEQNNTLFLSSHIIPALTGVCDCIFHIHRGTLRKIYLQKDFENIEKDIIGSSVGDKLEVIASLNL